MGYSQMDRSAEYIYFVLIYCFVVSFFYLFRSYNFGHTAAPFCSRADRLPQHRTPPLVFIVSKTGTYSVGQFCRANALRRRTHTDIGGHQAIREKHQYTDPHINTVERNTITRLWSVRSNNRRHVTNVPGSGSEPGTMWLGKKL